MGTAAENPAAADSRSAAPPPAPPRAARGGILAPLLGGVVAAGLGFGAAQYVPEGWPFGPGADRVAGLARQITGLESQITALSSQSSPVEDSLGQRLDALEARPPAAPDQGPEIAALREEIATLKETIASLSAAGVTGPGGSADLAPLRQEMTQELDQLRAEIAAIPRTDPAELAQLKAAAETERAAITARAEALRAEAETTARTALLHGAVLRLQAALETGAPLEAALTDLTASGIALPEALSAHAAGLPSLAQLQADFPEVARTALTASTKPAADAGLGERMGAFFSAQTGMRSLTPQAGDDPDAVLSRAEAAVQAGDLALALTELSALPPEGQAAATDWHARAQARLQATAAAQSLIATIDKP